MIQLQMWCLVQACFLFHRPSPYYNLTRQSGHKEAFSSLKIGALHPEGPTSDTTTLGVRISTYELRRGTSVFTPSHQVILGCILDMLNLVLWVVRAWILLEHCKKCIYIHTYMVPMWVQFSKPLVCCFRAVPYCLSLSEVGWDWFLL